MFPATTTNLYCPGCSASDIQQPHICGQSRLFLTTGFCYLCNQPWTGSHICVTAWQTADTSTATLPATQPSSAPACDHCWCLKQKAGWHDVPSLKPAYPGYPQQTDRRHLKPHQVCCNCGGRRVKA